MTTRELVDNNTPYSTTRYAFITVIKFDIIMIILTFVAYVVSHFIKKPLDNSFFYGISTLLGILTALVSGGKILQGFERKDHCDETKDNEKTEDVNKDLLQ